MHLTCPCCAARFPVEAALTDDAARVAVAAALKLPAPLGDLTLRYLGLFRPAQRALAWDRAAKLLQELLEPIQAAQVRRNGCDWAAPLELWRQGLEQVLEARERLTLPLKGHGYLFEVVAGMASKSKGAAEVKAEKQRAYRPSAGKPERVAKVIDRAAVQAVMEGMRKVIK